MTIYFKDMYIIQFQPPKIINIELISNQPYLILDLHRLMVYILGKTIH